MNRKQSHRRLERRRAHHAQARRPRNLMRRASHSTVKQAHIVPKAYQANFAVDDRVALHVDGRCMPANIKNTGTRGPYRVGRIGAARDAIASLLLCATSGIEPHVAEMPRSEAQRAGERDHRRAAGVNRFDDLGVVDAWR
jgi:hypothetical protein